MMIADIHSSNVCTRASQIGFSVVPHHTLRLKEGISPTGLKGMLLLMPEGMNFDKKSSKSTSVHFNIISLLYCFQRDTVAAGDPVTALLVWCLVEDVVGLRGVPANFALWLLGTEVFIGVDNRWAGCCSAQAPRDTLCLNEPQHQ